MVELKFLFIEYVLYLVAFTSLILAPRKLMLGNNHGVDNDVYADQFRKMRRYSVLFLVIKSFLFSMELYQNAFAFLHTIIVTLILLTIRKWSIKRKRYLSEKVFILVLGLSVVLLAIANVLR